MVVLERDVLSKKSQYTQPTSRLEVRKRRFTAGGANKVEKKVMVLVVMMLNI